MAIAITEQTAVFFHSLLLGAVLGCFYDLFRITRIAFVIPALLVLVEDLLFFLFSSIVLFGFMLGTATARSGTSSCWGWCWGGPSTTSPWAAL